MIFSERPMKQIGKSIFLSVFLVFSAITAMPFSNLTNSVDNITLQSESSALVSDLGVRVGDMIYYRLFDSDLDSGNESLPQGVVMEYEIQSMTGEELHFECILYDLYGDDYAGFGSLQDYATEPVFCIYRGFRMFQLTTITDYAIANGTTVENMDQAWRNEINSITEPISTKYDSIANNDYHLLNFGGYVDDNSSHYREMEVWVDKETGLVSIMNETEPGRTQYKELMGYKKGSSSILLDWNPPTPSNFHIGNTLITYSPNMDNPEEDYNNNTPGSGFFEHTINFMYRNPETLEDVVVVELREYETPTLDRLLSEYPYREEGRTIENDPSSVFGSLFFDHDVFPTIYPDEFGDIVASMMDLVPGYSTVQEGKGIKTSGIDALGHNAEYYLEGLDGYGFQKVQWTKFWNGTDTEWNLQMTINGTGVIESHPDIGVNEGKVSEGDFWTVETQSRSKSHNWSTNTPDEWQNESKSLLSRYRVTNIFALNATVMAVFGRYTADDLHNRSRMLEYNLFHPILIFDTNDPATFLTYGGFATEMSGPPVLLPIVADWSTYDDHLKSQFESDLVYGMSVIDSSITSNGIKLYWDEEDNYSQILIRHYGHIILESTKLGIVKYLDIEKNIDWDDGFGTGGVIQEEILMECTSFNGNQFIEFPEYLIIIISIVAFATIVFIIQLSKK